MIIILILNYTLQLIIMTALSSADNKYIKVQIIRINNLIVLQYKTTDNLKQR